MMLLSSIGQTCVCVALGIGLGLLAWCLCCNKSRRERHMLNRFRVTESDDEQAQ